MRGRSARRRIRKVLIAALVLVVVGVLGDFVESIQESPSSDPPDPTCGSLTDGEARAELSRHFKFVVPEQFRLARMEDHCIGSGWMADPAYEYVGRFSAPTATVDEHSLAMPSNYVQRVGICADTAHQKPTGLDCAAGTAITLYHEQAVDWNLCTVLVVERARFTDLYADCQWGYIG